MSDRDYTYCEGLSFLFSDWLKNTAGFTEVCDVMIKRAAELRNNKLFVNLVIAYRNKVLKENQRNFDFITECFEKGSCGDRRLGCMQNDSDKYATVICDILRSKVIIQGGII